MLASLFDLVRDIAVLAAAWGIAWWCWEQYKTAPRRRDEAARAGITAERQIADIKLWMDRLDARTNDIAQHLARLAASGHETEERVAAKVRVHHLLQTTTDPFLTFAEIERALAPPTVAPEEQAPSANPEQIETPQPLTGDRLRRVLIELIGDGAIAQLDHDRYFIASDYEAGGGETENGETEPA